MGETERDARTEDEIVPPATYGAADAARSVSHPGFATTALGPADVRDTPRVPSPLEPSETDVWIGRVLSNVYRVEAKIGEGGMGAVYAARHVHLNKQYAIKVLSAAALQNATAIDRLKQEAVAASSIDHDNIVDVTNFDQHDGSVFIVMELLRGESLAARLGRGPIVAHDTVRIAQQICGALGAAHARGIVHRDLKPENVFLSTKGGTERVKVLDFGISKVKSAEAEGVRMTRTGQLVGTPLYMSPEQARGERSKVGPASDVWSLGVMLYELVCGTPPFTGPTLLQVLDQVRSAPVPPLSKRAREVPRDLAAIVGRALERDAARRYPSAAELASDLRAFLDHRTVGAYAYSAAELVGLFVRRHRTPAAVGAIGFLLLLVAVVALARAVRQNRESLAEAFVEKGRLAEGILRWEEASVWFAAARDLSGREDAAAGLRVVWPRTKQQQSRLLFGHTGAVKALVGSPDGATLYSGSADHSIRVWHVATGLAVRVLEGHSLSVNALSVSPDGATLFSGGEDDHVRRWDTRTGASEVLARLPDAVNALAVSPDGATLAIGGEDGSVGLVGLKDGLPAQARPFGVHAHPVYAVVFSPDGALVASGSWDGVIQVRRVADGALVAQLRGHAGSVLALGFNPAGTLLASTGRDTTVRFWSVDGWHEVQSVIGNTQKVYGLSWSDDGEVIASAGADGTSRVWAGANKRPMPSVSLGRDDELLSTTFLHGTSLLATGGRRGLIGLRSISARSPLGSNWHDVVALTEIADGRIALQHNAGFAFVAPNLKDVEVRPPPGVVDPELVPAHACIVNRAGTRAFGSANDASVRFFDVATSTPIGLLTVHTQQVEQLALSPDEATLATVGKDGRVLVWNTATRDLRIALPQVKDGLFGVAFAPNGKWLASAGYDRKVRVYETATWQQVHTLEGHEHGVRTVAFSPDSTLIASAGWDRAVRLWRAADGAPVATMYGHQDVVFSVDFSPDGKRLASGSHDGTIRVWDVQRHVETVRFTPDEGRVNRVLYSRDGKRLYYVRQDLHRIDLVDEDLPHGLDEVLTETGISMQGLRLQWTPRAP